jgi:DNA-binding transcriptional MerR regulator
VRTEQYRPAEAASLLGVPSSTLRLYSVRFAPLLSESAAEPLERAGGRPGYRVYAPRDLDVLKDGKRLLEQGFTFGEALEDLGRRWHAAPRSKHSGHNHPEAAPTVGSNGSDQLATTAPIGVDRPARAVDRDGEWRALTLGLMATLESAQALASEWRRISEDRSTELAALKEQLRQAEEEARRPWWRRLFGA